jgi:UDP-N-acetylglucosamine 3-dehydrogenase
MKGVELVAVADVNPEAAQELAGQYEIPHIYRDYQDLLDCPEVDAVSICTPDAAHRDPSIGAAQAGKHILLEKPIATTMEDAREILDAVDTAGVVLTIGFVSRFLKTYSLAHKSLEEGKLGGIMSIAAKRIIRASVGEYYSKRDTIIDFLSIHDVDLLHWFGGDIVSVYAEADSFVFPSEDKHDTAMALLRFANGAIGYFHGCWTLPSEMPYRATSTFEVIGTEGVVNIDAFDQSLRVASSVGCEFPIGWDLTHAFRAQLQHFIDCAQTGKQPLITGEDGLKALAVAIASGRSAREHRPVEIKDIS